MEEEILRQKLLIILLLNICIGIVVCVSAGTCAYHSSHMVIRGQPWVLVFSIHFA